MAVSIMLTSCGKLAGLSNGGKKAGNKIPVVNANTKSQPQKNNDTGNKTLANDTRTKNLPQKIDNDKYKQSLTDYAKDHKTAIGFISVAVIVIIIIAVGSCWIINKNNNKFFQPSKKLMPLPVITPASAIRYELAPVFTNPLEGGDYDHYDLSLVDDFTLVYFYNHYKTILDVWCPPIKKELADRGFNVSSLK